MVIDENTGTHVVLPLTPVVVSGVLGEGEEGGGTAPLGLIFVPVFFRCGMGRASDCRSRGPGFESTYCRFETWATSFTPVSLCLSEETLKPLVSFYLVPGEVKDPNGGGGECVTCCGFHLS